MKKKIRAVLNFPLSRTLELLRYSMQNELVENFYKTDLLAIIEWVASSCVLKSRRKSLYVEKNSEPVSDIVIFWSCASCEIMPTLRISVILGFFSVSVYTFFSGLFKIISLEFSMLFG